MVLDLDLSQQQPADQLETASENYHVLIVEDDLPLARAFRDFLEITGPFKVDTVWNIAGLWEQLENQSYDIILMDYRLPDGTGLKALEEIDQRGHRVPVILVTGQGDERLAVQAMRLGAVDYLVKGSEALLTLPGSLHKAIRADRLQRSVESSLTQIRYQAMLLNNVNDAIVVWNTNGDITYTNPAAQSLFGWAASEFQGRRVDDYLDSFIPPIQVPGEEATGGIAAERSFRTMDDRILWVSSRLSVLSDFGDGERLVGYMDVSRDITRQKQMEAEVHSARERLIQAAQLTAIGELASGMAHHINNPLTTIIAEAQILLQSLPDIELVRESAKAIEQAGWRVQGAVQRLLDFSKPTPNISTRLSVNETIQTALALIGEHIQADGIKLVVNLDSNLPDIQGNARQLVDLWINLLLQARSATTNGEPHSICISSRLSAECAVVVELSDDGDPIPAGELETLFEPTTAKKLGRRGTGIELGLCQEIVSQHNGIIYTQTDAKRNTIFYIQFPTTA